MLPITPTLFIGNQLDYENSVKNQPNWATVHACKEPYHREALGYKEKGAPKGHSEYLFAVRDNRLILNLVDSPDYRYISDVIIDKALDFIDEKLRDGLNVLVHCNLGESRSPSIGLLYLVKKKILKVKTPDEAMGEFKKIYPNYAPKGIWDFIKLNWKRYID
ncbi:MAG: phosphatase [Spirochaetes bacterium GWC1_27_15]|nr:MAG: phosphatase [Spirochaetes bacterium GWB1_27_13]OHD20480.1 MAG: phosphatase [Spirochaetes bacterium GWC1_27_15]